MQLMRTPLLPTLLGLSLTASPTRASAQDEGDLAAYIALNFSQLGGVVPLPPPGSTTRGSVFD